MSALSRLVSLASPYPSLDHFQVDWAATEEEIGTRLPADYKQLIDTYGCGTFDDYFWVLPPAYSNKNIDLVTQNRLALADLRHVHADGEPIRYAIEEGAEEILLWGQTEQGDNCYWVLNQRDPDSWTVTVNESRSTNWFPFEGSMSEFLVAVLAGDYKCEAFGDYTPSPKPIFSPDIGTL